MSKLWFNRPAENWEETLPIGNGKLGAMIYGTPFREHYQLNEDSVWYGGAVERSNPDSRKNLEKVRALILEGKVKEAEHLMVCAFTGNSPNQSPYQPLGDLFIEFSDFKKSSIHNYRRELDLENAVHTVTYEYGEQSLKFTTLASFPLNCIAIRIESLTNVPFSFTANLTRSVFFEKSFGVSYDTIALAGSTGSGGVGFCAMIKACDFDGNVLVVGDRLLVSDSTKVTLLLTASTTYRTECPLDECEVVLNEASSKDFDYILSEHLDDYKRLYNQIKFDLFVDKDDVDLIPIDEQLKLLKEKNDKTYLNHLVKSYFDYGRYLMISGSRPGSLPLTLQGIWNQDMNPAWDSKYTININTEMNYWPAEICGLSECHIPLMEHVSRMMERGKQTAQKMYGCRGFVCHHNTDLWADCAPEGDYIPGSYWVMGAAWLSLHLWEHYIFNPDTTYLKSVYPILKEASIFFLDFLIPYKDFFTVCPTVSPENSYFDEENNKVSICAGATMDYQIMRDLFSACIESAEILEIDDDLVVNIKTTMSKLPPHRVGSQGQLLEWIEEYPEAEPGHRHISHLYGLYPSHQISLDKTPDLAAAAKKTLERRLKNGGGHTGWSLAWIINLYARLQDSHAAHSNLIRLLSHSTQPNLLDFHPPFQIDGNFGGTAAVVEMLVQSDRESITLLPALPDEWTSGSICGARIRGGGSVDVMWENNQLKRLIIHPYFDYTRTIIYKDTIKVLHFKEKVPVEITF